MFVILRGDQLPRQTSERFQSLHREVASTRCWRSRRHENTGTPIERGTGFILTSRPGPGEPMSKTKKKFVTFEAYAFGGAAPRRTGSGDDVLGLLSARSVSNFLPLSFLEFLDRKCLKLTSHGGQKRNFEDQFQFMRSRFSVHCMNPDEGLSWRVTTT